MIQTDLAAGTAANVGLFWHLRDPTGKLVFVGAGRLHYDTNTDELIFSTPNSEPGFADVICPLLGGNAAS